MPTDNAIVIVANHRTGSGLLASILHTLGVAMLPTPQPTREGDDKWEDHEFVALHREIFQEVISGKYDPNRWRYPIPVFGAGMRQRYRQLLLARRDLRTDQESPWGFKDPRTVFVLDFVLGLMTGLAIRPKCIWLRRGLPAIADSLRRRDVQWPTDNVAVARHQFNKWGEMHARYSQMTHGLKMQYEKLTEDPAEEIRQLVDFLAPHIPSPAQIAAAVALVRIRR